MKRAHIVADFESSRLNSSPWSYVQKNSKFTTLKRIGCISVTSNANYKYAIPVGRAIIIYRASNDAKHRRISGFSKNITCCSFRPDGKLIIGGEEGGLFRICTTDRNTFQLRKIQAHDGDLINVDFFLQGLKAISLGSDCLAKIWDISLGEMETKFLVSSGGEPPHCLAVCRSVENMFAVGNFDGVVKLFDVRQPKPTQKFKLPCSVSALHLAIEDTMLMSAAAQSIYAWDIVAGKHHNPIGSTTDKQPQGMYSHYKLITGLTSCRCPDLHSGEILLSVGMDKLLKFTSLETFEELNQKRVAAPITAVGVSPAMESVIIGCENGYVRTFRFSMPVDINDEERSKLPKDSTAEETSGLDPSLSAIASGLSGYWRTSVNSDKYLKTDAWFRKTSCGSRVGPRDWGFDGGRAPLIHPTTEISRFSDSNFDRICLTRIDRILSRFEHSRALSASLSLGHFRRGREKGCFARPTYVYPVAVVRELSRRGVLSAAVGGRNDVQLFRLLRFIRKHVWLRPAMPTCILLFKTLNEVYPVSRLAVIPDFVKVCRLIQLINSNVKALAELSSSISNFLSGTKTEELSDQDVDIERCEVKQDSTSTMKKRRRSIDEVESPSRRKQKNRQSVLES